MDFEHSRLLERSAAQESEIRSLREQNAALNQAISAMNGVCRHQLNEVFPPMFGGAMKTFVHPLTCGNDSNHPSLYPYYTGSAVVLRCPSCTYEQAHLPVCVAAGPSTEG